MTTFEVSIYEYNPNETVIKLKKENKTIKQVKIEEPLVFKEEKQYIERGVLVKQCFCCKKFYQKTTQFFKPDSYNKTGASSWCLYCLRKKAIFKKNIIQTRYQK